MKQFFYCFHFEFKRSLRGLSLILALLFTLMALYFVNNGANAYNDIITEKESFKKIEKMKVERYRNYTQLGEAGFRVIYIPPPLSVFFSNSGSFSNLNASMHVGEHLDMSNPFKGKEMFNEKQGNHRDFSGLFLLFGTLLILFNGFKSLPDIDYLKHLTVELGFNRVFFPLLFARFAVMGIFSILVTVLGVLLALLKGIALAGSDYLFLAAFLAMWLLLSLVLLALGIIVSRIKDKRIGVSVLFVVWIFLVYLLPMGTDQAAADSAKSIKSNYQLEFEKLNALMNFEERAINEVGKYSKELAKTVEGINLMDSFFRTELLNMLSIEKKLDESIDKNIKSYQNSSVIFLTPFYQSVSKEMSGKGYENSSQFLLYLVDLKYKFCIFIKNKRFYSDDEKIEPFIKDGEENVYYASAHIPGNFPTGIIVLAIYAIALIIGAYFLVRFAVLNMRAADVSAVKVPEATPGFKKGEHAVIKVKNHKIKDFFYCLLAGLNRLIKKKGFTGSIVVDGTDIVETQNRESLTYIFDPGSLPTDSTVGDFLTFSARSYHIPKEQKEKIIEANKLTGLKNKLIGSVEYHERSMITLALADMLERGKSEIYLFYNTAMVGNAETAKVFKDKIISLEKSGKLVIYLSTNLYPLVEEDDGDSFFCWDGWNDMVDHNFASNKKNKKEEQQ
jgi:ABC-type transport system involved in multi-copper enzyme maturation permease subunit